VPNLGCIKGAKQLQIWCCVSPLKWLHTVGSGVIVLKKHHFFPQRKLLFYCFNLFRVFTYVSQLIFIPLTVNDASVCPEGWV
jgi:hypothetical protein